MQTAMRFSPQYESFVWQGRGYERERAPIPTNPSWMSTPVWVQCTKGFFWKGRLVKIGEVVSVDRYDALGLEKRGRCQILKEQTGK